MNTTLPRLGSRVRISFLAHSKASHFGGLFSLAWQGFPRVGNLVEDQEEKAYALTHKAYIPMVGVEAHFSGLK